MNCESIKTLLEVPAHEIPQSVMLQVQMHLRNCRGCDSTWQAQRLLAESLRLQPAPAMPEGFAADVLTRVFAADLRSRRRRTIVAYGLAATLVFGTVLGFGLAHMTGDESDYQVVDGRLVLQSEHPTTIGVAFNAGTALKDVRFTIDLPAGMQVAGQPGVRHLSWSGELRKGQNLLKLPVIADQGTDGALTAVLSSGAERRTFQLQVVAEKSATFAARLKQQITQKLDLRS
jgi:hypothetical protein